MQLVALAGGGEGGEMEQKGCSVSEIKRNGETHSKTMTSSYKFRTPGKSDSISDLVFWNISAAAFTPNKSACNVEYQ